MTRSTFSPHSIKSAKKALKIQARQEGKSVGVVLQENPILLPMKLYELRSGRRNQGRDDGIYWKTDSYICARNVDDAIAGEYADNSRECNCDYCIYIEDGSTAIVDMNGNPPQIGLLGSLLDIAKPAKVKGIAKDFEVIESLPRVIALHDDDYEESIGYSDWEEWEEVYEDEEPCPVKEIKDSYSTALKAKEPGTGVFDTS